MTFWKPDAAAAYRATILSTTGTRTLSVADLDVIERSFRDAWAAGERAMAIWQYHDGRGYMPPTRLWLAVHAILDRPDDHPPALVARAKSLHAMLVSAADCDAHERAVQNDARIVARWREELPVRLAPPTCTWATRPTTRRSR